MSVKMSYSLAKCICQQEWKQNNYRKVLKPFRSRNHIQILTLSW